MKNKSPFLLLLLLLFSFKAFSQDQVPDPINYSNDVPYKITSICPADTVIKDTSRKEGIYMTKEDFLAGRVKYVGKCIETDTHYFIFQDSTGKKKKYKDDPKVCWGYRDHRGISYVIKNSCINAIIQYGAVTVLVFNVSFKNLESYPRYNITYDDECLSYSVNGFDGDFISCVGVKTKKVLEDFFQKNDKKLAYKFDQERFPNDRNKRDVMLLWYIAAYDQAHPLGK